MTLALVAALLMAAGPTFAGGGEGGDWELGIYGGYGWLDDYGIFHPDDGFLYGGRVGYFFTPNWNLELSAQRLPTTTEFEMPGVQDVDVNLDAVRLNLLYNFASGERFRPFLTAGIGRERFATEGFGESCDIGLNAGAGFRWFLSPHWNLRVDGRYVRTKVGGEVDETQQNLEATLGLGWVFGGGTHEEESEIEAPAQNQPPTASCAIDRAEILPGESVSVRATASDPEGGPLTYQWSSDTGRVTGTGATATFDFADETPPASATITVRVLDDHGNAASCASVVRLLQPVRPAQALSCLAGGFPEDLFRLNNVDKACLDDVTQRLNADPRARVIVIGHADSYESSPEAVAQQRAEAVKEYLVEERGVEASRITVRSAMATKPLDAGTSAAAQARNRRVEVWFVPEGATIPD
jgi:outer membrane protein OmpA-like peptidoglycan-associated protein/opacity protein-like surface antigen